MGDMRSALKSAGLIDQADRLQEVAVEALVASHNAWPEARRIFQREVQRDASLLWELFKAQWDARSQEYLNDVSRQMLVAQKPVPQVRQGGSAPILSGSESHPVPEERIPTLPKPSRIPLDPQRSAAITARIVTLSLLDTFRIDLSSPYGTRSISIGDCTPTEAKSWAGGKKRDIRFVEMLIENLPPNEKIRKHRQASDVEAFYAEALNDAT